VEYLYCALPAIFHSALFDVVNQKGLATN